MGVETHLHGHDECVVLLARRGRCTRSMYAH
jgi:hypothetical protein